MIVVYIACAAWVAVTICTVGWLCHDENQRQAPRIKAAHERFQSVSRDPGNVIDLQARRGVG